MKVPPDHTAEFKAAGACAVVGGFYGMALGALAAGIYTRKTSKIE